MMPFSLGQSEGKSGKNHTYHQNPDIEAEKDCFLFDGILSNRFMTQFMPALSKSVQHFSLIFMQCRGFFGGRCRVISMTTF